MLKLSLFILIEPSAIISIFLVGTKSISGFILLSDETPDHCLSLYLIETLGKSLLAAVTSKVEFSLLARTIANSLFEKSLLE